MNSVQEIIAVLRGRPGGMIGTLFVSQIGLGMLTLSLPLYLASLHATPNEIGLTLSMYGVGMLVFEFGWGWLADRTGVPVPLIISRVGFSLALLGFVFFHSIFALAFLYMLASGMMVANGPLGRSFLGVALPKERRGTALGIHQAQGVFGSSLGAMLAGLIADHWGVEATFYVSFIFPLLGGFVALYAFRKDYGLRLVDIVAPGETRLTSERQFSYWYAMTAISLVVMFMLVGFSGERGYLPLLVTVQLGHPATDAGVAMSVLGLAGGALMIPCGRVSDRFGRKPTILAGLVIGVIGLLAYSLATAFAMVIVATLLRALSTALAWPSATALIADSTPRSRQGLVMGIYGEFENVGMMAGPLIAGFAWTQAGIPAAFYTVAGFVAISAVLCVVLIRERQWRATAVSAAVTA